MADARASTDLAVERALDLLRAGRDRWRTLTHLAPVGLVETDVRGRCVFANDAAGTLADTSPQGLHGLRWRARLDPEDRAALDAAGRAALRGGGSVTLEVRCGPRWLQVDALVLRDPEGVPAGWLGAVVDVTPARRAREDLRAAERELRRQQEAVLAMTALARDASVAEDPVPLLCAGARTLLGAEAVDLVGEDVAAPDDPPVVGGGAVRVRWPGGAAPAGWQRTVVALLAAELGTALERRRLLERLRGLARTDPLTGLANRRLWDERLGTELARAARSGRPLCAVALDLDRFKAFNDRHGHAAGDALLRDTTAAWSGVLRTSDLLARLGGDEFALLLPDCDPAAGRDIVGRLQASTPGAVGCSAGLAVWSAGEDADALMARADGALYAVKAAGRGGVRVV